MVLRRLILPLALFVLSTGFIPALSPSAALAEDEPAVSEKAEPGADAKPAAKVAKKPVTKRVARQPTLWVVEGTPKVYLFGTIHIADPRVLNLMPVVRRAFDSSDAVYTELAMDGPGMMEMQVRVMARSALPAGQTLTKLFGAELHARVAKALPPTMPLAFFESRKPWLVNLLLTQAMLKISMDRAAEKRKLEGVEEEEAQELALDQVLYTDAQKAGKQVGALETIDQQLDVFDKLSLEKQVELTLKTVEAIEELQSAADDEEADPLAQLVDFWLAADVEGFMKLMDEEANGEDEEMQAFMERLLNDRNVKMVEKIQAMRAADSKTTYFIAVGAAHMPGEKGLVGLLQSAGLTVRKLKRDPAPAPSIKKPAEQPAEKPAEQPAEQPAGAGK